MLTGTRSQSELGTALLTFELKEKALLTAEQFMSAIYQINEFLQGTGKLICVQVDEKFQ